MTNETPAIDTAFSIAGYTGNTDALPANVQVALIKRGLRVVLGSEAARAVHTWKSKEENANATPEAIADVLKAAQAALWEKITTGTLGHRESGGAAASRVTDPVEKEVRALAKQEVTDTLKALNMAFPTKDKVIEFANGEKLDGPTLITRRIAKHGDRLRAEAKKIVAARERALAKGQGEGDATIDDLL